jgi:hypothetical protein
LRIVLLPDILTLPSVTRATDEHRDRVVVAGSHGAIYAGHVAAKAGMRAVILNDAGLGKDRAGIAALRYLDALGFPAATVSSDSARIGDGDDMAVRGVISHVNETAAALGCRVGESAAAAAAHLDAAALFRREPLPYHEARHALVTAPGRPEVWTLDSVGLVRAEDVGQIVVTGSHGGLLAGEAASAIKVDARAVVYNDAGVGIDSAGISRLPALDARGIAAATVAAATARIGDGRSTYESGRLSHVNETARSLGVEPGLRVHTFVQLVSQ